MYETLGISKKVLDFAAEIEEHLKTRFQEIDERAEFNQLKVIHAMQECRVSDIHFAATTGYGYNDLGRDTLEEVYAHVFHTESALVRPQLMSGTHALHVALSGNLRPGDELLSPVGKPYDTLEEVIGIRDSVGSLKEYGISYRQVDLLPDGTFDYENIAKAVNEKTKLVTIQRSKGYDPRPTFSVKQIGELIAFIKKIKPEVICMVDNCYGEFVETIEPTDVGADMIVDQESGRRSGPYWRLYCRKKGLCRPCFLPIKCPRPWKRGGRQLRTESAALSGSVPFTYRCSRSLKGSDFCRQYLRASGLRRSAKRLRITS